MGDDTAPKDNKTGWPAPVLMQDDHQGLSKWFSRRPYALSDYLRAKTDLADNNAGHYHKLLSPTKGKK